MTTVSSHQNFANLPPSNPALSSAASHYDQDYFNWHSRFAPFAGWANVTKFNPYIRPDMKILDFGCGGGYLLANLECREKLGVEINPVARAEAARLGITAVASTSEVEDGWADVIISNHTLEHCPAPLQELIALRGKVRPGGTVVFVVPCEAIKYKVRPGDPNHHLYSWSPMSAYNLFEEAGFHVLESKAYIHIWPPRFIPGLLRSLGGRGLFDAGCRIYGLLTYLNLTPALNSQVRIVATRP